MLVHGKKIVLVLLMLPLLLFGQEPHKSLSPVWSFQTEAPIRGATALNEHALYFGNSAGMVYALDQKTGQLIWQFDTGGAIVSQPALTKELIFITNRSQGIYALDIRTGDLRWQFSMSARKKSRYAGWKYHTASPVLAGDKLYVGSSDGYLYALDQKEGELRWKFKTGREIAATPLVSKTAIYQASNDGIIYVLDPKDGSLQWTYETEGAGLVLSNFGFDRQSIYTQPILKDNLLLFGARDGKVYAVDIVSRQKKWSFSYGPTWAMSCQLQDDLLFVGWSTNNMFSALDVQTGEKVWDFRAEGHNYTKAVIVGSDLFFGSADGNLYRFHQRSGKNLATYTVGSEIYSSPQYKHSTLFFGSDDGRLYALAPKRKPVLAVYEPDSIKGNAQYLKVNDQIAPYLQEKGFEKLDSSGLYAFVNARIRDQYPSAIVFTFPLIPKRLIEGGARASLIWRYLEGGGKIIWFGDVPNFYELDDNGNFKRDPSVGSQLLDVTYLDTTESGNYYSRTTQEGLNWGFPSWMKTTGTPIQHTENIIPFAYDEFGRVSAWRKPFSKKPGTGFLSFRTWAHNIQIKKEDLELIYRIAIYGL